MKNFELKIVATVTVCISICLFFSCKKEIKQTLPQEEIATARSSPNQFYHTCANGYADQTGGSEGVAASVNVEKLSLQGGNIKSWWMGAYYYIDRPDGVREEDWVQWGYAVDRSGLFPAFYVYEIYPNYRYKDVIILNENQNVPLKHGTRVRFEIKHSEGTIWSFLRDGQKVYDVDLGASTFDGTLQSCTESWGSSSFSTLVHVDYLDTYKNGVWSHIPSGQIGSASWNISGRNQRPSYQQSEHEFGGKLLLGRT